MTAAGLVIATACVLKQMYRNNRADVPENIDDMHLFGQHLQTYCNS